MTVSARMNARLQAAYEAGRLEHGYLDFESNVFFEHVDGICAKRLTADANEDVLISFVDTLHCTDLYLACGCLSRSSAAWTQFTSRFRPYVLKLSSSVTASDDRSRELADSILIDLFLPDRSGRSRIGSYCGRSSLATWLRVLVSHRAINERKRQHELVIEAESFPDPVDDDAVHRVHAEIRSRRYSDAIRSSLREACARLTERDRLILKLRFTDTLKVQDIAAHLAVHPANVSRKIDRICRQMRLDVMQTLGVKFQLSASAIEECVDDVLEGGIHSILSFLGDEKRTAKHTRVDSTSELALRTKFAS